jgi:hypothetical protein
MENLVQVISRAYENLLHLNEKLLEKDAKSDIIGENLPDFIEFGDGWQGWQGEWPGWGK